MFNIGENVSNEKYRSGNILNIDVLHLEAPVVKPGKDCTLNSKVYNGARIACDRGGSVSKSTKGKCTSKYLGKIAKLLKITFPCVLLYRSKGPL